MIKRVGSHVARYELNKIDLAYVDLRTIQDRYCVNQIPTDLNATKRSATNDHIRDLAEKLVIKNEELETAEHHVQQLKAELCELRQKHTVDTEKGKGKQRAYITALQQFLTQVSEAGDLQDDRMDVHEENGITRLQEASLGNKQEE